MRSLPDVGEGCGGVSSYNLLMMLLHLRCE